MPPTTILELRGEGGSITLLGLETTAGGWQFQLARNEAALADLLDDGDLLSNLVDESGWVKGWQGALTLLGRYPWWRLHAGSMDGRFRERILAAARERGGDEFDEHEFTAFISGID